MSIRYLIGRLEDMTITSISRNVEKLTHSVIIVLYPEGTALALLKIFPELAPYSSDLEGKKHSIIATKIMVGESVKDIICVGVGKVKDVTPVILERAVATGTVCAQKKKHTSVAVFVMDDVLQTIGNKEVGLYATKGVVTASYRFQQFFTKPDARLPEIAELCFAVGREKVGVLAGAEKGLIIGEAINAACILGNQPGGHVTPKVLAKEVKDLMKGLLVTVKILGEDEMKKRGMGAILGVSAGSQEEAQMVVLEYMNGGKKPITALCGKGITFDSGGISIKPAGSMEEMKFDMLGAATVAGAILALATLNTKVNVVGILACAENLPSGAAMRPGDIVTAANGTTIEVINTDAEGRLVLADAICLAQEYKPAAIIDLATLTGACVVALGSPYAGLFSNHAKLRDGLLESGRNTGDKLWELPCTDEYRDHIKSSVADIKNVGQKGEAGATSGAMFLKEFVGETPWAHLDIAGVAWRMQDTSFSHGGATGFGVHLLVDYLS